MTEESADVTLSIHKTQKGAEDAIERHKTALKKEYDDRISEMDDEMKEFYLTHEWDMFKSWNIIETLLQD